MNNRVKNVLTVVGSLAAIAILILILVVVIILPNRIKSNPPGTVGNTAGNLNNGGLFCESDGIVYFSNVQAGGSLYSMTPDEGNITKLNEQKVQNILAGGEYLYFFQTGAASQSGFGQVQGMKSFDRCKRNGKDIKALTKDVVVTAQLVDNYLYLLTSKSSGPVFYKMKIDKSESIVLANYIINPACADSGTIYYNGTVENHYLYSLNTSNDSSSELWRGNLWNPIVSGDYVYYMDVANNYRLSRYSFSRNEIEILTKERIECFNVGGEYVYYQTNGKDPRLMCMLNDGSSTFTVAEGIYTSIHLTSRYVYFMAFGDENTMYHCPLGSSNYSVFSPK